MRALVLVSFLSAGAMLGAQKTLPPAEQVYAAALERARADETLVFFEFGASWCAPCRRLEAFLSAPETSAILAKYYVVSRITVWENKDKASLNHPGGSELMYRLGGGDGVPYFGIADAGGRVLESSRKAGVDYPANRAQVETFIGIIDRTAKGMSPPERKILADFLVRHADTDGSIGGRVLSSSGAAVVNAEVVMARRTYRNGHWQYTTVKRLQTDEAGRYLFDGVLPGDYVTRAEHTTDTAEAESTSVGPGDDLTRDLVLRQAYGALSGRVLEPSGEPASTGAVHLTNVRWPEAVSTTQITGGRFELSKLVPGRYVLSIQLPSSSLRVGAQQEITIAAGERRAMDVVTHHGSSLSGTILLPPDAAKVQVSGLEVLAIAVTPPGGSSPQTSFAPVTISQEFTFQELFGSRYIRVRGLPEGWYVEAVRHGGIDTTDAPLELSGNRLDNVEILISDAGGQISGTVKAPDGTSSGSGAVIVFPNDSHRHTFPSRFVRRTAVDDAGTFAVAGLPPGDYRVAAVNSLSSAWDAPESLAALKGDAATVRVERRGRAHVTVVQAK